MTTKKTMIIGLAVLVAACGAAFYGGTVFERSHGGLPPGAAGFTGGPRAFGQAGQGGQMGMRNLGGGAQGDVIAKDGTSMTVKLADGGSKIVLLAPSTAVAKSSAGTLDDVAVGANVIVTGTANADGSITAQSVRVAPAPAR